MSTRTKLARKAATAKSYVDQLDGSSDEFGSDGEEVGEDVKRSKGGKGKGKGRAGKNGGGASSGEDDRDEPARKKRRTAKGKGKGKGQGKKASGPRVDLLKTMPMDLLVEIFSYLLPSELLALSRTSKPYRQLLTSKQSKPIWRRSRRLIEMPDLEADDMSEMAYAQLVFDKICEVCSKGRTGRPDYYLRLRLCSDCSKDNYLKLSTLHKTHPHYHPTVDQVVASTPRFALRADLDHFSQHLYDLQDEDEADIEARSLKQGASTRSGRASRSQRNASRTATADCESSDSLTRADEDEYGPLVTAFVKERRVLLEAVEKDAQLLNARHDKVVQSVRSREYDFWNWLWIAKRASRKVDKSSRKHEQRELRWEREEAFWPSAWREHKLVDLPKKLTDEEWLEIKDDILEVVEQARAEAKVTAARRGKEGKWDELVDSREEQIKSRYKSMRDNEDDTFACLAFPREADFLLFESVKSLQLPKKMEDDFDDDRANLGDEEWGATLPLIKEELDEYRLNLFLHTVKLILSATMEPDEVPDDDEILDNPDKYNEACFSRATSFLCCDDWRCYERGGRSWYSWVRRPSRPTFVGSLQALLEHQHAQHGSLTYWSPAEQKAGPRTHFSLPLEVSCAISALIELGELDETTAGAEELDDMDRRGWYEWENTHCRRKRYSTWRDLLDHVYREAKRYAKMKPPRAMDPPCIVYHLRPTPLPADADKKAAKKSDRGYGWSSDESGDGSD
ncbi:hypothetical protein JCM6882_004487 [Rhodosporidiobolus microsporus]